MERRSNVAQSGIRTRAQEELYPKAGRLDSLFDQTAPQATRAYANSLRRSIDDGAHPLQVGIERPLGLIIGMADVVTTLMPLQADIACKCHGRLLTLSRRE